MAESRSPRQRRQHSPRSKEALRAGLRTLLRGLLAMYGPPPFEHHGNGLDMLVSAMLAQNTNMANADRGYARLRRRFRSWTKVMNAPQADVQREIAICGLARMRARRLQELLRRIKREQGKLSLEHLRDVDPAQAYESLLTFHGIGPKTAAYVCLFAFDQPVLPVDNGILRVLGRLKLVRAAARDAEAERLLSPLIATGEHYATHILAFRHAKARCRPKNPKCVDCRLLMMCPFGQRRVRHQPPEELAALGLTPRERDRLLARFISAGLAKRGDAIVSS